MAGRRRHPVFVAIDFETSHYYRDSACAVGLVRVKGRRVVAREFRLIRPPRRAFHFTEIHGLRWRDVVEEPRFGELWPELLPLFDGVDFIAAHNASFDKGVLRACCERAGLLPPDAPFLCTVRLARTTWELFPTKLPNVCDHLGLALNHHDAASDAEACARIVIAADRDGAEMLPTHAPIDAA